MSLLLLISTECNCNSFKITENKRFNTHKNCSISLNKSLDNNDELKFMNKFSFIYVDLIEPDFQLKIQFLNDSI